MSLSGASGCYIVEVQRERNKKDQKGGIKEKMGKVGSADM